MRATWWGATAKCRGGPTGHQADAGPMRPSRRRPVEVCDTRRRPCSEPYLIDPSRPTRVPTARPDPTAPEGADHPVDGHARVERVFDGLRDTLTRRFALLARWYWLAPLFAIVLFVAVMLAVFYALRQDELDRQHELLSRDVQETQQTIGARLLTMQDEMMQLAHDFGSGKDDEAGFMSSARTVLRAHPELISIAWVDTDRQWRRIVVSDVQFDGGPREEGDAIENAVSGGAYDAARDRRQPRYSGPYAAADGDMYIDLHVPLIAKDRFDGTLVAVTSLASLARLSISKEAAAQFNVSLVDGAGGLLVGRLGAGALKDARLTDGTFTLPLGPPLLDIYLRGTAFRIRSQLADKFLVWAGLRAVAADRLDAVLADAPPARTPGGRSRARSHLQPVARHPRGDRPSRSHHAAEPGLRAHPRPRTHQPAGCVAARPGPPRGSRRDQRRAAADRGGRRRQRVREPLPPLQRRRHDRIPLAGVELQSRPADPRRTSACCTRWPHDITQRRGAPARAAGRDRVPSRNGGFDAHRDARARHERAHHVRESGVLPGCSASRSTNCSAPRRRSRTGRPSATTRATAACGRC